MQLQQQSSQLPTAQMPPQPLPQTVASDLMAPAYADVGVGTNDAGRLGADINISSIEPPHPDNMAEPPHTPRMYNVFTAGDCVGIADGRRPIDTSTFPSLPFFSMRKFPDWNGAHLYYTQMYRAREIYIRSSAEHQPPALLPPVPVPTLQASSAPSVGPPAIPVTATAPLAPVAAAQPAPAPAPPPASVSAAVPPPSGAAPVSTGASATDALLPGTFASPLGHQAHPIFVSSAFPTPIVQATAVAQPFPMDTQLLASDKHPLAVDKLLPAASRLQKNIQDARLSPTGSRSKMNSYTQQKLLFPKSSTQSSSSTRVIRNSKGKGKEPTNKLNHPNPPLIDHDDSDDSDEIPGRSYPKARQPAVVNASVAEPFTPSITLTTPSAPAPAVLVGANALASSMLQVQTPPNKRQRTNISQVGLSPSPATSEEYNSMVQAASRTPRSAKGSAIRLALIQQALATPEVPSPTPSPQYRTENRRLIIEDVFRKSPSPQPRPHNDHSPSVSNLFFPLTPSKGSIPGPSTVLDVVPQITSPETDYGLDSDMDARFLQEASVFLDQGRTRE